MKRLTSPRGFLAGALVLAAAFGAAHALGWRDEARFLSGTPANLGAGVLYVLLYFGFVLGAPSLAIGAAVLAALERLGYVDDRGGPHV